MRPFAIINCLYDEPSIIQTPSCSCVFRKTVYTKPIPSLSTRSGRFLWRHSWFTTFITPEPRFTLLQIGIRPTLMIPDRLGEKAFIAYCTSRRQRYRQLRRAVGRRFLETRARSFGAYCILTDDEPPPSNRSTGGKTWAASSGFSHQRQLRLPAACPACNTGERSMATGVIRIRCQNGRLEYF